MATTKPDVITLTYEEAEVLEFLAEAFLDDNRGNQTVLGSAQREKYSRSVLAKLEAFTDIGKRCGAIGPEDSKKDRPLCRLRPHSKKIKHRALDIHTMKPVVWAGDKSGEYLKSFTKE